MIWFGYEEFSNFLQTSGDGIFSLIYNGVRFSRIISHERYFFQFRNFFLQVFPCKNDFSLEISL